MSEQLSPSGLKQIMIAMLALAKAELEEDEFSRLEIPAIQTYVHLITECIPADYFADRVLMRHAFRGLLEEKTVEEIVMHNFLLAMVQLSRAGSQHPLERGIIRQKIIGLLPRFEVAVNKGLIRPELYDRNADALSHLADHTDQVPALLEALHEEYLRFHYA